MRTIEKRKFIGPINSEMKTDMNRLRTTGSSILQGQMTAKLAHSNAFNTGKHASKSFHYEQKILWYHKKSGGGRVRWISH